MSARRPLLTALGATSLLAALWFVPSANATAPGDADTHTTLNALTTQTLDAPATDPITAPAAGPATDPAAEPATDPAAGPATDPAADPATAPATDPVAGPGAPEPRPASATALALADTGGVDTTPYLLGGTLCLGLGAGFVAFSVRRSQAG
ncbi:hypothetical protein EES41_22710 [Streptomyces sp. ADI95-16]|uniref:hypothetical protein n=1 Tax=Streptomyces sp. ADI95-16 TaxID=1522758 RepID=UPI000F436232|nr:hypothetical protein [Streptomyces sp. ADI95-16]AYV29529.1 hypothetical protein EES41_22710 [Streptomyces sp. ADI95-16]